MTRLRALLGSRWFRLALSLALLAALFARTDLTAMRRAIAGADAGWLLVALLALISSQATSAYRWFLLSRAVGFAESFAQVLVYYFAGMYLNLFGPGTVTGDVGRTLFLGAGRHRALALTTVVAHRATGLVALVWITAAAILLLPKQPLPGPMRWIAALAIPAVVVLWLRGPRLAARLLPADHRWRRMVERDLEPYWRNRRLLALTIGWAATAHLLQLGSQVAVARALALDIPWSFFLVVVPLINVLGMIPVTLQGIGVRETGFLLYLSRIGVDREQAIALGVMTSAVVLLAGLSGLPFFLLRRRTASAARAELSPPSHAGDSTATALPPDARAKQERLSS